MNVDYSQVVAWSLRLRDVPKDTREKIRPALRRIGAELKADMGQRASWSSRIPAAIVVATSFRGGRREGVTLRVDADRAPHARPYEGISDRRSYFRHPVFGNREVWVSEPTRPFFFPAIREGRPKANAAIEQAVIAALPRR